jgi:hypothetical protein
MLTLKWVHCKSCKKLANSGRHSTMNKDNTSRTRLIEIKSVISMSKRPSTMRLKGLVTRWGLSPPKRDRS